VAYGVSPRNVDLMTASALRVCLAASAGGHLSQLLRISDAWAGHDLAFVTTLGLAAEDLRMRGRTYVIGECNRDSPLEVARVFSRCRAIAMRERPDVVISTGAAPGLLMCLAAKLVGARMIWIDSIANVERLSLSGQLARPIADLMLAQWPDVAERHRGVEYVGSIV
jgi:UDP-N-acetylglucosamine:LPS N-acetylglucosamine transferase